MRRDNFKQQGGGDAYIDWLKSKGCRFYAPMDAEHGLDELIQGWTPNINPNLSCVWDNNMQAYLLTGNADEVAALMYSGKSFQSQNVGNYGRTLYFTFLCDSYITQEFKSYTYPWSGGGNYDFITSTVNNVRRVYPTFTRVIYTRNGKTWNLNQWHTDFRMHNPGYEYTGGYNNGSFINVEVTNQSSWNQLYTSYMDEYMSFGQQCICYVKNVYVFNTYLNNDDLLTIYNHDHQ